MSRHHREVVLVMVALVSFHTTTCIAVRGTSSFIPQMRSSSHSQLQDVKAAAAGVLSKQDDGHVMTTSCSMMKPCKMDEESKGVWDSSVIRSYISMKALEEHLARMHVMMRRKMLLSGAWNFVSATDFKLDDKKGVAEASPQEDFKQRAQQSAQKPHSEKSNDDHVNSAGEDDEPGEDIEVKDYAHPGRKPPIHNRKH